MSAVSVDGVAVSLIPSEVALELLKSQPELAVEVARRLSRDRHMLLGRLAYLTYGSVRERLARGLRGTGCTAKRVCGSRFPSSKGTWPTWSGQAAKRSIWPCGSSQARG